MEFRSCLSHAAVFLLLGLMTSQGLASVHNDMSVLGVPSFQWKFLSTAEKAAVDKSLDLIRSQRMKNVSLGIVDGAGMPYTGALRVIGDSTSFISLAGWVPSEEMWEDYLAMTPSLTYYVGASWRRVESTKGYFDFHIAEFEYSDGTQHGMTNFHIRIGPRTSAYPEFTMPDWAKELDYVSLKSSMKEYVNRTVSHFRGRIQFYHIWPEANADFGNGNWPLDRIIDIIKMEAATIRSIDPDALISIDLVNRSPDKSRYWGPGSNWSTEYFVRRLLSAEVPFDIIGLETHYGIGYAEFSGGIDTLYYRLIDLSKFGKPLYIWEDGLESSIDPNSLPESWVGAWHGEPSEEKQAEYMVAETIVYLGNPSVLGVHWYLLADLPLDQPLSRYQGVLHANGTRKQSFYALENLWKDLKTDTTIQLVSGVATFTGLAGEYTVSGEGYLPVNIHVAEELSGSFFNITLTSTKPRSVTTSTSGTEQTPTAQIEQISVQTVLPVALISTAALTLFFVFRRYRHKHM